MPRVRTQSDWPKGTIRRLPHVSRVLANNPWKDPAERELSVYLPPGYSDSGQPYAVLWDLAAYTNSGPGHLNWRNQGENLPDRLDRLIGQGKLPPVLCAFPDCYTSLGGNQYLNSPAVGYYADYLNEELVPLLDENFNVISGREGRAAFGKSSGGYGSLFLAMHFSEIWGAAASHAGDAGFDLVYRRDFPVVCEVLSSCNGDTTKFIRNFWRKKRLTGRDFSVMMILAMAASYDPDESDPAAIRLPFDLRTCKLDAERWERWLAFDPINMVDRCLPALRTLHGLYIDVGIYDQYHIQYGTRQLVDKLNQHGVSCHYEEFEGTHSSIDWRLDLSLPFLAEALKNGQGGPN